MSLRFTAFWVFVLLDYGCDIDFARLGACYLLNVCGFIAFCCCGFFVFCFVFFFFLSGLIFCFFFVGPGSLLVRWNSHIFFCRTLAARACSVITLTIIDCVFV